jgi:hypothetical protein
LNEFTTFVIGLFFFGLFGGWWGKENFRIPALIRIQLQETFSSKRNIYRYNVEITVILCTKTFLNGAL